MAEGRSQERERERERERELHSARACTADDVTLGRACTNPTSFQTWAHLCRRPPQQGGRHPHDRSRVADQHRGLPGLASPLDGKRSLHAQNPTMPTEPQTSPSTKIKMVTISEFSITHQPIGAMTICARTRITRAKNSSGYGSARSRGTGHRAACDNNTQSIHSSCWLSIPDKHRGGNNGA
jgi:hypothetical protein